jgi:hypothetical protein
LNLGRCAFSPAAWLAAATCSARLDGVHHIPHQPCVTGRQHRRRGLASLLVTLDMPHVRDLMWPVLKALKAQGGSGTVSEIYQRVVEDEGRPAHPGP